MKNITQILQLHREKIKKGGGDEALPSTPLVMTILKQDQDVCSVRLSISR